MSLAALARQMHEAGTPVEGILLALEAVEARDRDVAARKAKTAARKQAQRDRERDSHGTVTGQSEDIPDTTPSLDKESFPQTPFKEINPIPVRETRTRGERIPEGWKPRTCDRSTKSGQIIESRGQQWAKETLEDFTNHWRAKAGRDACKVDWQATWANWITEQHRRDGRNGHGTHQPNSSTSLRGSRPDPSLDLLRRAREAEDAAECASDDSPADRGNGYSVSTFGPS